MKREYLDFLTDITESANAIHSFIEGINQTDFEDDKKTLFAVIHAIEIIGEAANRVPKEIKDRYQEIPWRDIVSMRNRLIHEYFGVNIPLVWESVKKEIPELCMKIEKILEVEKKNK
ncbi:MAG: DUF86 domain-containing protein [Brevinematales bacterium]|nr:DUF86 domain-containing protein [Brevinematales bacterium]